MEEVMIMKDSKLLGDGGRMNIDERYVYICMYVDMDGYEFAQHTCICVLIHENYICSTQK